MATRGEAWLANVVAEAVRDATAGPDLEGRIAAEAAEQRRSAGNSLTYAETNKLIDQALDSRQHLVFRPVGDSSERTYEAYIDGRKLDQPPLRIDEQSAWRLSGQQYRNGDVMLQGYDRNTDKLKTAFDQWAELPAQPTPEQIAAVAESTYYVTDENPNFVQGTQHFEHAGKQITIPPGHYSNEEMAAMMAQATGRTDLLPAMTKAFTQLESPEQEPAQQSAAVSAPAPVEPQQSATEQPQPASPGLNTSDLPTDQGRNNSAKLQGAIGAPVRDLPFSGIGGGGHTSVISIPGMTPELATKFIDEVLVPERNKLGIPKDHLSFAEGSGKEFLSQKIETHEIVVEGTRDGFATLAQHSEGFRQHVQQFMQEHHLGAPAQTAEIAATQQNPAVATTPAATPTEPAADAPAEARAATADAPETNRYGAAVSDLPKGWENKENVISLQRAMAAADPQYADQLKDGLQTDGIDGKFGPRTAKALQKFAADHNIDISQLDFNNANDPVLKQLVNAAQTPSPDSPALAAAAPQLPAAAPTPQDTAAPAVTAPTPDAQQPLGGITHYQPHHDRAALKEMSTQIRGLVDQPIANQEALKSTGIDTNENGKVDKQEASVAIIRMKGMDEQAFAALGGQLAELGKTMQAAGVSGAVQTDTAVAQNVGTQQRSAEMELHF